MSLEESILSMVIDSPELMEKICKVVEAKTLEKEFPASLTIEEFAAYWKISTKNIRRMSDEEIAKLGFTRKKAGVKWRFERIAPTFREMFDRINGNK